MFGCVSEHMRADVTKTCFRSLLIATCLIVAIRTVRWSATIDVRNSNSELDQEIKYAAGVAHRVLSAIESDVSFNLSEAKTALVQSHER